MSTALPVSICDLRERPRLLETLVKWLHAEWVDQQQNPSPEASLEALFLRRGQLREHLGATEIPCTLVAFFEEPVVAHNHLEPPSLAQSSAPDCLAKPLGCVSLSRLNSSTSGASRALWLSNLFVDPGFRGTGVGERLVQSAETKARECGEPFLYLYTRSATEYYKARGWELCVTRDGNALSTLGDDMQVLRRRLNAHRRLV